MFHWIDRESAMIGDIGRGIGEALSTLWVFAILSLVVAWPLAIWKLIDIALWLYNNVSVTVR